MKTKPHPDKLEPALRDFDALIQREVHKTTWRNRIRRFFT